MTLPKFEVLFKDDNLFVSLNNWSIVVNLFDYATMTIEQESDGDEGTVRYVWVIEYNSGRRLTIRPPINKYAIMANSAMEVMDKLLIAIGQAICSNTPP